VVAVSLSTITDASDAARMIGGMQEHLGIASIMQFLEFDVESILHTRAKERFADEGDDAVGAWAPLASRTVDIRDYQKGVGDSKFGGPSPINRRTDEMYDWVTSVESNVYPSDGGAMMQYPGELPGEGSSLYEKYLVAQNGRSAGTSSAPARPVVGIGPTDLLMATSAMAFHLGFLNGGE
jgi:hypothetical protein